MELRRRILLVDDNVPVRSGLRALLRSEPSFEVVAEAADGETAVRLAAELSPDVVLMDVHMPVMDGIEATRRVREAAAGRDLPMVIAVSASTDDTQQMFDAGAIAFLPKDQSYEVVASVKAILSRLT